MESFFATKAASNTAHFEKFWFHGILVKLYTVLSSETDTIAALQIRRFGVGFENESVMVHPPVTCLSSGKLIIILNPSRQCTGLLTSTGRAVSACVFAKTDASASSNVVKYIIWKRKEPKNQSINNYIKVQNLLALY